MDAVIQPEQVLVNVVDLQTVFVCSVDDETYTLARARLISAIPEPEWEPTDEQRQQFYRYDPDVTDDDEVERRLKALHREGLL